MEPEYQYDGPGIVFSELISYAGVPTKLYTLDSFFSYQGITSGDANAAQTSKEFFNFMLTRFNSEYDFAKENPVALVGFVYGYSKADMAAYGVDLLKIRPTEQWSQNNMIDSWTFEKQVSSWGSVRFENISRHKGTFCLAESLTFNEELKFKMLSRDRNSYIQHTVPIPPYLKSKVKVKA